MVKIEQFNFSGIKLVLENIELQKLCDENTGWRVVVVWCRWGSWGEAWQPFYVSGSTWKNGFGQKCFCCLFALTHPTAEWLSTFAFVFTQRKILTLIGMHYTLCKMAWLLYQTSLFVSYHQLIEKHSNLNIQLFHSHQKFLTINRFYNETSKKHGI